MPIEGDSRGRSGEARRDLRFELRLGASMRTDAGVAPIELIDVSRGGALVEAWHALPPGTRVTLCLERLEVGARVVWVDGGQLGLAFDRPIRATDLFFQLGRSRAAARPQGGVALEIRSAMSA